MSHIAYHFQNNVNGWPQAVSKLKPGSPVKFVFGAERAMEASAANPGALTWYRWVGNQPLPDGDYEDHCERWLRNFVDGTFIDKSAKYVDFIQGYNETLANSQTAEEKAKWIQLHTAMAKVWEERFRRKYPSLAHIRIILCETAVGNDIPWQIAKAAQDYDALLGYHPYIVCNVTTMPVLSEPQIGGGREGLHWRFDGPRAGFRENMELYQMVSNMEPIDWATVAVGGAQEVVNKPSWVSPHDWRWYSGRWAFMDAEYVARGIKVDWAFGEMGPVRDASPSWSGWLDPMGGWKHSQCLNGSREKYIDTLRYWMDNMVNTSAYKQGRVVGGTLFTSGSPGSGPNWRMFEVDNGIMDDVAQFNATYDAPVVEPPPPPPPPPPPDDGCRGKPRVQYHRTAWVLPSDISDDKYIDICKRSKAEGLRSVMFSYDDGGIGDLDEKTVVLWGIPEGNRDVYRLWYQEHYPGTEVLFQDLPPVTLALPVEHATVSQRWGQNYDRYMEKWGLPGHNGVDFAIPEGTLVRAARGGTVRLVAYDPDGYGNYIRLLHEDGVETYYAHLEEALLINGGQVSAGEVIGLSGNTGWSTGPHLHFGVKVNGTAVDPETYTGVIPIKF